jgi:uncharacterized repeat protein (TIGR04138 family)
MQSVNFELIIDNIRSRDSRYAREAYHFVREALDYTQRKVHNDARAPQLENRHVTGQQLLEGIREFALQTLGPMTLFTFEEWGVRHSEDFGNIVFNLVEHGEGMFGKTEEDSREDFKGGYDFSHAFRQPFLPQRRGLQPTRQMREA